VAFATASLPSTVGQDASSTMLGFNAFPNSFDAHLMKELCLTWKQKVGVMLSSWQEFELLGGLNCTSWLLTSVLHAHEGFWGLPHSSSCEILLAKDFSEQAVDKLEDLDLVQGF
jgi:hypothetical protein